jgi:hypothetical protein
MIYGTIDTAASSSGKELEMNRRLYRAVLVAGLAFAAGLGADCERGDANKAGEEVEKAADKAGDTVDRGLDKAGDAANRAINSDAAREATDQAREAVGQAAETAGDAAERAGDEVQDLASPATEPAEE